jgi:Trk K+ transport system NAD-binding subunit
MDSIFFLILRRMRTPLLTLVITYTVAVFGLALIPGRTADGAVWYLDFFHAFYFVSYMATTIGFGEIPHEFSAAQRLWVMFCIYGTVIVWFYFIGSLVSLLQNKTLQRAIAENRFENRVNSILEPFYLVCGYGQTGGRLVRALSEEGQRTVVIDAHGERINLLKLENLPEFVPALHADARLPDHLLQGGLRRPNCQGVLALTSSNEVNLKIAIAAKLLHPQVRVICRSDSHDIANNMRSFGTDHIYDPFDIFALRLATTLQAPCLTILRDWLSEQSDALLRKPNPVPPVQGLWILCGYGRFGKAIYEHLIRQGLTLIVIEATPERTGQPPGQWVHGRGTEAETLEQANVHSAVGLIAGTDHDANNLSIIMTARQLNPHLFIVLRENQLVNQQLFQAIGANMCMHPSAMIAERIRLLLRTPLLDEFINHALFQEDDWACHLVQRLATLMADQIPEVWELKINDDQAYAVVHSWRHGLTAKLGDLYCHPRRRDQCISALALLCHRNQMRILLPSESERLREGDRILFCGTAAARSAMRWTLQNEDVLSYVLTGNTTQQGWFWKKLLALKAVILKR